MDIACKYAHHIVIHSTAEFIKRRLMAAGLVWRLADMAVHLNIAVNLA